MSICHSDSWASSFTQNSPPQSIPDPFALSRTLVLEVKIVFEWSCLQGLKPVCFQAKVTPVPPSSGLPGSVIVRVFLAMNLSVGSHGAVIGTVGLHRDFLSLRQFLGCYFGLQFLKIKQHRKNVDTNGLLNRKKNIIYEEHSCSPLNQKKKKKSIISLVLRQLTVWLLSHLFGRRATHFLW